MRWLFGRRARAEPDPDAFFAVLRRASLGERYTPADRYRDFRAVFFGQSTPEQGKRVLWQILCWCRLFRPVSAPGDPHETYRRDGERNIGLKIFMTLNAEPDAPESVEE
jgi:rRNA maturation protein Nop10